MQATREFVALAAVLISPTLLAHHGSVTQGALYHADVLTELEGEIVEVLWRYPHARGSAHG